MLLSLGGVRLSQMLLDRLFKHFTKPVLQIRTDTQKVVLKNFLNKPQNVGKIFFFKSVYIRFYRATSPISKSIISKSGLQVQTTVLKRAL